MSCVNVPPSVNTKCIVFTLVLAIGYWYLPERNKWVLLSLLYFPYVALAWYDYKYQCQRNLGPTYLAHYYDFMKPEDSQQIKDYRNWCPKWKNRVLLIDVIILIVLILLITPFIKWIPKSK